MRPQRHYRKYLDPGEWGFGEGMIYEEYTDERASRALFVFRDRVFAISGTGDTRHGGIRLCDQPLSQADFEAGSDIIPLDIEISQEEFEAVWQTYAHLDPDANQE